ncbi:hypothetical protein [Dyella caseinilytica]|uniref:DUF1566 domain-containing protein n=1 Tax=Dyella caseinilytica TaxID=1849581 RepID=A0ABX7GXN1_9GAMM|nr:hypothetical protein [Dyella caseinilytica]QRN55219.1 hypothetical protein ISN74_07785 [Dyella caseinilytica]GGA00182.1 hypothetical protein GCM10011408_21320 [Dyella caseinilytica]
MNAQISITPRDRLIEVVEWLEAKTPLKAGVAKFNMSHWIEENECGTSCCLAGTIVQFDQAARGKSTLTEGDVSEISDEAANEYCDIGDYAGDLCGLNPVEAQTLFTSYLQATPAEASETIRRFLDSGKLYWDRNGKVTGESDAIIRSRQLPTKNSVLLGADGKPLADGDTNVVAVLNTVTGTVRAWKLFGNKQFQHERAIATAQALPLLPGHTSWDLSSKADLEAILASSDEDVFDIEQYPDIIETWHWAKDIYGASSSVFAWSVDFNDRDVYCYYRNLHKRALAVCRPVPASQ